jgi:hypothetical protein
MKLIGSVLLIIVVIGNVWSCEIPSNIKNDFYKGMNIIDGFYGDYSQLDKAKEILVL